MWIIRAASSLPLPDSPVMNTGAWLFDSRSIIDRTWAFGYRGVLLPLGGALRWVDRYLVDGLMNGLGWGTLEAGQALRPVQTGRTRDYALAVVVGAVVLLILGAWR